MRAAVISEPREVDVVTVDDPAPGPRADYAEALARFKRGCRTQDSGSAVT
jgi:hypothetical protein